MGSFLLVMLGWGLFSGFGAQLLPAMLGRWGAGSASTQLACAAFAPILLVCCGISFLPAPKRARMPAAAAPVLLVLCLAALAAQGYAPFVYFQF
jgi:hypothetical protein